VVSCWEDSALPLDGVSDALRAGGMTVTTPGDPQATAGITGADAALAATGSLVLTSGPGRYRLPSLLPPRHIALVRASQILPTLEAWVARRRDQGLDGFQASSNIIIISGPSLTADIAMELVLGMHGPGALHIILIDDT
jgi:L-lactate dehydrogenase complex protein LldG